tara:strand:- start:3384 stop:3794 length:411 start_codon:yes stop_codon:yes gene_type:complete
MKLQLEHLAPYLPYGLKCKSTTILFGHEDNGIYEMGLISMRGVLKGTGIPILRPLSDLTKDIGEWGEFITTIDLIRNEFIKIDGSHRNFDYPLTLDGKTCGILSLPYWVIQKLFEWHFDVFGLIEKGLAIDINTLS